jgi:hypothetical protein
MDQRYINGTACLSQTGDAVSVHGKGSCGIRLRLIHCSISRCIDADIRSDLLEHSVDTGLLREVQLWPATPHDDKACLLQAGEEFLG